MEYLVCRNIFILLFFEKARKKALINIGELTSLDLGGQALYSIELALHILLLLYHEVRQDESVAVLTISSSKLVELWVGAFSEKSKVK